MEAFTIKRPVSPIKTRIELPSSKSISNRLLVMQHLSGNNLGIKNLSNADDTVLMKAILQNINTHAPERLPDIPCELDCGNAGTVFRFLTAALTIQKGSWVLTGSDRMKQRPVKILCDALRQLGGSIEYLEKEGFPPIKIQGGPLRGGRISVDASRSSQYVSALLMVAPMLDDGLQLELSNVVASRPYIDMTLALMREAGISIHSEGKTIVVEQGSYNDHSFWVEPDWSSASYWYETVALMHSSEVLLRGLSLESVQGDAILADIFSLLGVGSYESGEGILIRKTADPEPGFSYNFSDCPDIVPAVAATCAALNIDATLSGLDNLRIKESDRIEALRSELVKINPCVSIAAGNTLQISKQINSTKEGTVFFNTFNDHRMAMALAPLAACKESVVIENPRVVSKSYPSFWDDFSRSGFIVGG